MENLKRPSWNQIWMEMAHKLAERSYDPRLKVGALVVSEDNTAVLGVGYNGNAASLPNTPESNEPGQTGFIHAEINALLKAPYHYPVRKVMYVTTSPCRGCAKCIKNAGIHKVIYDRVYRDLSGIELLQSMGIEVECYSDLLDRENGNT